MANPVLNEPMWAAGVTWTVTQSDFLALDIALSELGADPVSLDLTLPPGAVVGLVRDPPMAPTNWTAPATQVLAGGVWTVTPVFLGVTWTAQVTPGAAVSDPATLTINNPNGLATSGRLRIIITGLAGAAATVEPGAGNLSIDRVLADPTLENVQVSSGLPVRERAAVTLSSVPSATVRINGAATLPPLPALFTLWTQVQANAIAVDGWTPTGATASFTAPGIYSATVLNFTVTAAYDFAANGIDPSDPKNTVVLPVTVQTVTYGLVMVLDRSGSMAGLVDGTSQWVIATRAAHACCDLFRAFRPGNSHMAGVVTFEHDNCSWTAAPSGNITLRNPSTGMAAPGLTPLSGFGNVNDWNLGSPRTCTPIGDALVMAWDRIGSGLGPNDLGAVILLTDGYENAGTTTIAASKGPASQTFAQARVTPGAVASGNALIGNRVSTLAIGQSVAQDLLHNLGTDIYHRIKAVHELRGAMVQMMGKVVDADEQMVIAAPEMAPPPHSLYYQTSAGEQVVAFLVEWSALSDRLELAWRSQASSGAFTVLNPTVDAGVVLTQRGSHGMMRVDLSVSPFVGQTGIQWRLQHKNVGGVVQPLVATDAIVMVDLATKIEVGFDTREYFIGDPIRLQARLWHGGAPLVGATVGIDVARPGEGLGTFLATNAPRYIQSRQAGTTIAATGSVTGAGAAPVTTAATHVPAPSPKVDPAQGKALMYQSLLQVLDMQELPVIIPPQFELYDDGAHGDGAADDGFYAAAFTDTLKEGTYSFRFRVSGKLPDGSSYSRIYVRSTWVGVKPDPLLMGAVWTVLDAPLRLLTFRPKTRSGEFLGPFRQDVISLSIVDGTFDGPLVDNLDGSYSQRVMGATLNADPLVLISIYGTPMQPTSPSRGGGGLGGLGYGERCLCLWCRAFECTWRSIVRLFTGRK
jgi:hypothetical protein